METLADKKLRQAGIDMLGIAMDMIESGDATAVLIIVDFRTPMIGGSRPRPWLSGQRNNIYFSDGEKCTLLDIMILGEDGREWGEKYLRCGNKHPNVQVLEWKP